MPLTYIRDGQRFVVTAAAGGRASNPDWYHNLLADPEVTIEVGAAVVEAAASVAGAAERELLFARFVAEQPQLAVYQSRTRRPIPIVVLERRERRKATR